MSRNYDTLALHCQICDTAHKRNDVSCVCGERRPSTGWSLDPDESGAIVVFLNKRLGKRYVFFEILEHWGGTVVFRAKTTGGTPVRFALITRAAERGFSANFHAAGAKAREVSDPRIIDLIDHGSLKENGHYAVFELPRGHSLEAELAKGPLPLLRATRIMRELSYAFRALHKNGIALGKVTPEDVLLFEEKGELTLLIPSVDWLLGSAAARVAGPYTAPEMSRNKATQASDQYTLGRMMLEAFTGLGRNTEPGAALPKVPERIERLIRTMLEMEPKDRHPDLGAVILLLESRAQKLAEAQTLVLPDDIEEERRGITPYPKDRTPPPVPNRVKSMSFDDTPPPVVRWGSQPAAPSREGSPEIDTKLPIWMGILALGVAALALGVAIITTVGSPITPVAEPTPEVFEPEPKVAVAVVTAEPVAEATPEDVPGIDPIAEPPPTNQASPASASTSAATNPPAAVPKPIPVAVVEPEPEPVPVVAPAPQPAPKPQPAVAVPDPEPKGFDIDAFAGVWRGESRGTPLVLDIKLSEAGVASGDIRLTQGTKVSADTFSGTWSRDGAGVEIDIVLNSDRPVQYIGVLSGDLATGTVVEKGRTRGDWSARQ